MHSCPDCGIEHEAPPDPVEQIAATEARAEVKTAEVEGGAAIGVAEVEGRTAIQLAREQRKLVDAEREAELERLRARVEVLEQSAMPAAAEPIVVEAPPEAPPEPEPPAAPPPPADSLPPAKEGAAKRSGYWSSYR